MARAALHNMLGILAIMLLWPAQYALAADTPRFVSLKSSEVNVRTGPGIRYPVRWVYRKKRLPMEVIDEYDHWRKVRDVAGETGWVHRSLLSNRRTAVITSDMAVLFRSPDPKANPVIRAERGVIADILACENAWCRLQIEGRKGWVPKQSVWGAYTQEVFD